MKRIILMTILACGVLFASSQEDYRKNNDEIRTIFSKNRKNGGYGALTFGYGVINGKDAMISGGRGMFIFDHTLGIGFGGYGFINDLNHHHYLNNKPAINTLAGGYGGLIIEPVVASRMPVHLAFPCLIGVGGIALNENGTWWNNTLMYDEENDAFLVFEPSVELELNLTKFFRAATFLSYRKTSKITLQEIDPYVLDGLNFGITLKFGKF